MISLERTAPAVLNVPGGTLTARSVVLAHNAWAAGIPELSSTILPVTSTIVATAPIPERLKDIGWTGGEAITDSQLMVDYNRTTLDGRIAFGKGTGMISYGSRINAGYDDNPRLSADTEQDFRRTYPQLKDLAITHTWCGPIDRTYDSLPVFGHLKNAPNIVYGIAWRAGRGDLHSCRRGRGQRARGGLGVFPRTLAAENSLEGIQPFHRWPLYFYP